MVAPAAVYVIDIREKPPFAASASEGGGLVGAILEAASAAPSATASVISNNAGGYPDGLVAWNLNEG